MGLVNLVEAFVKRADACTALHELAPPLGDAGREIGFDYFALTLCDNFQQSEPRFEHLDTYPAAYAEVFVARGLFRFDPALQLAQRRIGGFPWKRMGELMRLQPFQSELLRQAARQGLRDGYTIPANVPGEPCGAVSFGARRIVKLTAERRWCVDCIGRTAFEASRRMRGLSAHPSLVPRLPNREVECLRRLILGDTDKEVARALGISPDTVHDYVKSARDRYAARTRSQLLALALRDSQIAFPPVSIPPIGGTDPG